MSNNHLGVNKLIEDIKIEISMFQSESEAEDELIIQGLLDIIVLIRKHNQS